MKIKAGTFNIRHEKDYGRYLSTGEEKIDLEQMADTVRKMDVNFCGLNGIRHQTGEGVCNQAEVIAGKSGWHFTFAPPIEIRHGAYGNALVSPFPIKKARTMTDTAALNEDSMLTSPSKFEKVEISCINAFCFGYNFCTLS